MRFWRVHKDPSQHIPRWQVSQGLRSQFYFYNKPESLPDLYIDKFINEMDRRLNLEGSSFAEDRGLKELSKKAVIEHILSDHSKTRLENYMNPLKDGTPVN
jgi:hypothetical protein